MVWFINPASDPCDWDFHGFVFEISKAHTDESESLPDIAERQLYQPVSRRDQYNSIHSITTLAPLCATFTALGVLHEAWLLAQKISQDSNVLVHATGQHSNKKREETKWAVRNKHANAFPEELRALLWTKTFTLTFIDLRWERSGTLMLT